MIFERWGGEASLEVKTDEIQIDGGFDLDVYTKKPDSTFELGAEQLDIILNSRPRIDSVAFPIETKNLDFFFQPPLTQQEILNGAFRPEAMVGSYAIYHKYRRGNEYKAGKVAHLLRPLLIDDGGAKAWADLLIDRGKLVITLPSKFLDKAKYPVTIDPTFGKTNIGGSFSAGNTANKWGTNYQTAQGGKVDSLHVYTGAVGDDIRAGIYNLSSNSQTANPNNLLWGSGAVTPSLNTWNQIDIPAGSKPSILASTWYWLGWRVGGTTTKFYYDSGAADSEKYNSNTWGTAWSDPFETPSSRNLQWSVYATYTTEEASKIPVFMKHYRSLRK